MSDQTTPPTEEPTAAVDSPQGIDQQQQAPQQDWERDYKELQREFTRTRQQMTDPEYQAQVAQEWLSANGYALPTDEPGPDEFADPNDALRHELEELKQWRDQIEYSSSQQQQIQALEESTEAQLAQIDGLDEADKDWIVSRAIALPPAEDGGLNVQRAYEELVARDQAAQKRWATSKQRAPYVPPGGRPANEVPDLGSHEGRVNNMMRLLHERE